eukprot:m.134624 g.134624  ORF g.134624 m.134624 type:complete len:365 (-) comp52445_c0_seq1:3138-4232(-)
MSADVAATSLDDQDSPAQFSKQRSGAQPQTPMYAYPFQWGSSFEATKLIPTPTLTPTQLTPSVFNLPSPGVQDFDFLGAELLLSARKRRLSSADQLDRALGTPLFSPNGTSHTFSLPPSQALPALVPVLTDSYAPHQPTLQPDAFVQPKPNTAVVLAPPPLGRRPRPAPILEPEDEEDDVPSPTFLPKRPAKASPSSTHAPVMDTPPKAPKRKAPSTPSHIDSETDFKRRDEACARAIHAESLNAFFNQLSPDRCDFVTVYPCRDAECSKHKRECTHSVSRFQSTRNSKRHVHALLFYKVQKGLDAHVPDDILRRLWKYMTNTCQHGLKNQNGHGIDGDGRTCINPHHYVLNADYPSIDDIPDD